MKYIVRKPYWNYEKEEAWLNGKSAQGLALTGYSWCRYEFEDSNKGEYVYRIELLSHPSSHPESQKYIAFLEDIGIEHVSSYMRWIYLRKKSADGAFDLYSDIDSKIAHYKKISTLVLTVAGIELGAAALNLSLFIAGGQIFTTNLMLGCVTLAFGILFIGIGLPPLAKLRRLKKERRIREA